MSDSAIITGPLGDATVSEIDRLVLRYRAADSLGMQVVTMVGGRVENLIDRLPADARGNLEGATRRALEIAFNAAAVSRTRVPDTSDWLNTVVTTAMGAAGGAGGMPTAVAELPVTTTVLLRAIQGIAMEHGFDPTDETTRLDCLQVFGAAGPLERDDGADIAFLAARVSLTGASLRGLVARLAPRLSAVLGQKLAAQAVPILGAVAGAAVNYAFTSYYQQMAHVYFGLKRLSRETGFDYATLVEEFRDRLQKAPR
jgi:uncharacterized protein (DUF697 family)